MADDDFDASKFSSQGTFSTNVPDQGFNPALIVLLVVVGTVLVFIVGNYALFSYARKTMPPRKKKPVSKKKLKRERLKSGVAPAGE